MGEVRFYHLTERPLEQVLPVMLERSLERGWRVVVRGTEPARIEALSAHLWTHGDASFLPHGSEAAGDAARQPVWLGCGHANSAGGNPHHGNPPSPIVTAAARIDRPRANDVVSAQMDGEC